MNSFLLCLLLLWQSISANPVTKYYLKQQSLHLLTKAAISELNIKVYKLEASDYTGNDESLPRKVTNMNGLYTISNPNSAATNEFNSDYNSFSDVEYFEVSP